MRCKPPSAAKLSANVTTALLAGVVAVPTLAVLAWLSTRPLFTAQACRNA
ncbi:hypothetical protein LN050_05380 [Comamonadaceae bacterium M7527]|nr:hypothetical protein LN050_05380 [Comamonadaceae bacterium M7527]